MISTQIIERLDQSIREDNTVKIMDISLRYLHKWDRKWTLTYERLFNITSN